MRPTASFSGVFPILHRNEHTPKLNFSLYAQEMQKAEYIMAGRIAGLRPVALNWRL
jgi:hypothetical protein